MRLGKWVPVYRETIPIPQNLSMAFGLTEGTSLHLAPIREEADRSSAEIIISPIPVGIWKSVCRLSVRLSNKPKALAKATAFLRDRNINILLTEACATYQDRAHWDAICDVSRAASFAELSSVDHIYYEQRMRAFLQVLTGELHEYIEQPGNGAAFLHGPAKHAEFSPLTGLNDSAFNCVPNWVETLRFGAGSIELPPSLIKYISGPTRLDVRTLPNYAIVTGNTEQRYLRLYFLRDCENIFRAIVSSEISGLAGGGVGVLNQFLEILPAEINLFKMSNYVMEKRRELEKDRVEIIGHWSLREASDDVNKNWRVMRDQFTRAIEGAEIQDMEGGIHRRLFKVEDFSNPDVMYPKVFISYSTRHAEEELKLLMNALRESDFQPVLGTDFARSPEHEAHSRWHVTPDVTDNSFEAMRGCVAFISLQVRRADFCLSETGESAKKRYILPPWSVAEEVFAWSKDLGMLIRLKDHEVEDPRYNKHILTFEFQSADEYEIAVKSAVEQLVKFRESPKFAAVSLRARKELYSGMYTGENAL